MAFSEIFLTNFYVATYALIGVMLHSCYQSKCSQVDLCCLKITRNTEVEEELDLAHPEIENV
jgi:hypothetical protein